MLLESNYQCSTKPYIGYAPISYFILGLIEILFSSLFIIIKLKRNIFQSIHYNYISFILPVYLPLLSFLLTILLLIGIDRVVGLYPVNFFITIIRWFILRIITEALTVFLTYSGIGFKSIRNSIAIGLLMSSINAITLFIVFVYFDNIYIIVLIAIFIVSELLLFHSSMVLLPYKYLHRRPAAILFSTMNCLILLTMTVVIIITLVQFSSHRDASSCAIEMTFSIAEFLQIIAIIVAFIQDSLFWQGLYADSRSNLNHPLLGIWDFTDRSAVKMVTDSIVALERKVVYIIPFSKLKVDTSKYFSGGSARVYRGMYQDDEVAIKFLFCIELTPSRVVEFCNEATVLNSLQHPNVIHCYGVAVMPPAISLVTEFCKYGSLFDFLHSSDWLVTEPQEHSDVGNENDSQRNSKSSQVGALRSVVTSPPLGPCNSPSALSADSKMLRKGSSANIGDLIAMQKQLLAAAERREDFSSSVQFRPVSSTGNSVRFSNSEKADAESSSTGLYFPNISSKSDNEGHGEVSHSRVTAVSANMKIMDIDKKAEVSGGNTGTHYTPVNISSVNSNNIDAAEVAPQPQRESLSSYNSEALAHDAAAQLAHAVEHSNDRSSYAFEYDRSNSRPMTWSEGQQSMQVSAHRDSAARSKLGYSLPQRQSDTSSNPNTNSRGPVQLIKVTSNSSLDKVTSSNKMSGAGGGFGRSYLSGGRSSGNMQSATSVLLSRELRYGLGPLSVAGAANPAGNYLRTSIGHRHGHSAKSGSAPSVLLSCAASSIYSLGNLLPISLKLHMARDCCAGLVYLHSKNIIHCDIKSLNFLVDANLVVKLADLGEARSTGADDARTLPRNINWTSPEILSLDEHSLESSVLTMTPPRSPTTNSSKKFASTSSPLNHSVHSSSRESKNIDSALVEASSGHDDQSDDEERCLTPKQAPTNDTQQNDISYTTFPVISPATDGVDRASLTCKRPILTPAADVWSLSMVIWEILSGEVPFDKPEFRAMDLETFVSHLKNGLRPQLPREFAPYGWLRDLLHRAWAYNPSERCTAAQMLEVFDEKLQ